MATGLQPVPGEVSVGGYQAQNNAPPPFLQKTYDLVDEPSTDTVVSWGAQGASFIVHNVSFVLPCSQTFGALTPSSFTCAAPGICCFDVAQTLQAQQLLLLCQAVEHICK